MTGMGSSLPPRVIAVVAGACLAVLALAIPAAGHAELRGTSPRDGETIEGGPDRVVLVFNEPMRQPATVVVTDPAGQALTEGDVLIDGERVIADLPAITVDGAYTVEWRAVSADDHPVSGEFGFGVADAEQPDAVETEEPEEPAAVETEEPEEPAAVETAEPDDPAAAETEEPDDPAAAETEDPPEPDVVETEDPAELAADSASQDPPIVTILLVATVVLGGAGTLASALLRRRGDGAA